MTTATEISLEALGLNQEKLADKLVERLADQLLSEGGYDHESGEWSGKSNFAARLNAALQARLDAAFDDLAEKHIEPLVGTLIDNVTFQETNTWGEPKKPAMSLTEYLAERAENWLRDKVNYEGKTKDEQGYNWSEKNSRIGFMVHQHLDYHIKAAITKALVELNKQVAGGLEDAVKIQLKAVLDNLKINVATGR